MKNRMIAVLIVLALALAVSAYAQAPTYVGAGKCQMCHKTEKQGQQYPIWEKSNHSKAFAALSSPGAAANAQALGVKDPATDAKCLKCHAPVAEFKAEGVTCEACHGAGSDYKSLSVMKAKDEAVKKGLKLYANPEAIKTWCLGCHKDAHGKSFDFAAAWDKIKHAVPAK
jgi:hypothetical protein